MGAYQPRLFELPEPPALGWRPADLEAGTQTYWAAPAEVDARLDAAYYVIARRPERQWRTLHCTLTPLSEWAEVNPAERRLPEERGYLYSEHCYYAEIGSVRSDGWLLNDLGLRECVIRTLPPCDQRVAQDLPVRAAYRPLPGDLLLPRVYSALHRAVMVEKTSLPLVTSSAFALLKPRSGEHGRVLLALLHHHVLGQQLWALASGTTVRSVTVNKLSTLQVPMLTPGQRAALSERVAALLEAQRFILEVDARHYWEKAPAQRRAHDLTGEVLALIDEALEWQKNTSENPSV